MQPNPGGHVDPNDAIGRNDFTNQLWNALEKTSLILVSERRMGKTTVINKMKACPKEDFLVITDDVEGISTAKEFVERLGNNIIKHMDKTRKSANQLKRLWDTLGELEIGGVVKLPPTKEREWKTYLSSIIEDLVKSHDGKIVLIWDEFPWMLQKIEKKEGAATVADLIDTLRSLRQDEEHGGLRMVYTGSIGLHHVIGDLYHQDYANSPVNDMRTVEVPPLNAGHAQELALALLRGAKLESSDSADVASLIAHETDGVAYYIHHVVASLCDRDLSATAKHVKQVIKQALMDAQDPWQLEHYRRRLKEYYGDNAGLVRCVLDTLADHSCLSLTDLWNQVKLTFKPDNATAKGMIGGDREPFRDLVKLVLRDHYLTRNDDGNYHWRFDLIKRWWLLEM